MGETITYNRNLLFESIKDKIGNPVNVSVVIAAVESLGIREKDVEQDYGATSIKELSEYIFTTIKENKPFELKNKNERESKQKNISISDYVSVKLKLFFYFFPLGLFHLFPIFLQIATIVIFGYSLWAYLEFNQLQSTAVVFGVILGLILSGGFIQVIGRQASFYWYQNDFSNAKRTIFNLIIVAVKTMFVFFVALSILNVFLYLYPFEFLLIVFAYAFLIGLLLLVIAPMHTIKQRWSISLGVLTGTVVAIWLKQTTTLNIYFTHWIGIAVATVLIGIFLLYFLRGISFKKNQGATVNEGLMIIHKNHNYFFYGFLLYVFIFIDRAVAWSVPSTANFFMMYYEKNYEVGMDIAILVFFLLSGVLEYSTASFSKILNMDVKSWSITEYSKFNAKFYRTYFRRLVLLLFIGLLVFLFLYLLIYEPWGYQSYFKETLHQVSETTAIFGSLGYLFLTWGVLNTLYLFSLNRPSVPVRAISIAIFVNLIVGILFSRLISYELSSIGMFVGSLVFMMITFEACLRFFKNLDYYQGAVN